MEGDVDIKKKAEELDEEWGNVEPADDYKPIPKGDYSVVVITAEMKKSQTGTLGLGVQFEVTDEGEHKGRRVYHTFWLTLKNLPNVKRDLEKLGCRVGSIKELSENPLGCLGNKTAIITVGKEEYEGITRNKVKRFKSVGGQMELPGA
jgi:hypothetical protein